MKRREVIAAIATAAAWPLAVRAQQADKRPMVAFLGDNAAIWNPWVAAFTGRLRELGWSEGGNVAFEYSWSQGRTDPLAEFAAEFVQQKVDVIVTYGGAALVLKSMTGAIPIVLAIAVDPVGLGLVPNLSRPGGKITGLSIQSTDLAGKRLELFREVAPSFRRLAIIFDGSYPPAVFGSQQIVAVARTFGLEATAHEIRRAEDIAPVFDAIKGQADALYVVESALTSSSSAQINALALAGRLPMMFNIGTVVELGALLSYGPNFPALFVRAAELVDKILHGTNPSDLPVEQPTKFDFIINLKTAKTLGLTVPDRMLVLADEVIE